MKYYYDMENMPKWVHESLVKPPHTEQEVASKYNNEGLFRLHFDDFLYVIFKNKRDETDYKDIYRPLDMPNYEPGVKTREEAEPVFDKNGIIVGNAPLMEGT